MLTCTGTAILSKEWILAAPRLPVSITSYSVSGFAYPDYWPPGTITEVISVDQDKPAAVILLATYPMT